MVGATLVCQQTTTLFCHSTNVTGSIWGKLVVVANNNFLEISTTIFASYFYTTTTLAAYSTKKSCCQTLLLLQYSHLVASFDHNKEPDQASYFWLGSSST